MLLYNGNILSLFPVIFRSSLLCFEILLTLDFLINAMKNPPESL